MPNTAILALSHISFAYPQERLLFEDLNFSLRLGQRVGLFAPNGSGKSTLLRLLVGLEKPLQGEVLFQGVPVLNDAGWLNLRRKVGVVLQHAEDQLFCPTVLEDVAFGPLNLGLGREAAKEAALRALQVLGLEEFAPRLTHKLSGGEKKMVALATVLSMSPEVLLLDEPAAGLDDAAEARLVSALQVSPAPRLVISHDRAFLEKTADQILTIANGSLAEVPF